MTKLVFVTDGIVSLLSKGIATALLAVILESRGLKITLPKFDSYINVDPGTMSPFQYGEVFVTEDGTETDLNLGYYERFVSAKTCKVNNFTTGQIHESVIRKEHRGEYLGKAVQIIPHITNEVQAFIERDAAASHDGKADVATVEIGGTMGNIKSLPFLGAACQMSLRLDHNRVMFAHLTLVPFIASAGRPKIRSTQYSTQKLREVGVQSTVLLCRAGRPIPDDKRMKISFFASMPQDAVILVWDVNIIYEVPQMLDEQGLNHIICEKLRIEAPPADLSVWAHMVHILGNPQHEITIGMAGKYVDLTESYKSLVEALRHADLYTSTRVDIEHIDSEELESGHMQVLGTLDAILAPDGFGKRGTEGKIRTIQYVREKGVPYLGICLGVQLAVIEFTRHLIGMKDASSTRLNDKTERPMVALITEWLDCDGRVGRRSVDSDLGGTMRLGSQHVPVQPGTKAAAVYGTEVNGRRRHRYGMNNHYVPQLEKAGMTISARTPSENLSEMMELPASMHPWFAGVQPHPEFTSTPCNGHPSFEAYVGAMLAHQQNTQHAVA